MSIAPYTPGNIPLYRFYISEPSSTTYEVFPSNFLSSALVDELFNKLFYRRKFNGSLVFGGHSKVIDYDDGVTIHYLKSDWDLFWAFEQSEPCTKLSLTITKTIGGVTTTYWDDGYFSTSNGKFDIDKCTFEVKPITDDAYTPILDLADIQYNILNVTSIVTTRLVYGLTDISYTRNRWLIDVIEYIAGYVSPGSTVSSDFFTVDPNYVTLHDNHLLYLTIAQKSDIIRPTSSNQATTAMLSWDELMEILWNMFQVTWEYDSATDTINIEHISWWTRANGLDLRTQLSAVATNKYSYLNEEMPKYEKFKWMEADNSSFVGFPIWYDSTCVNQDPGSNSTELSVPVTTDLEYIIKSPEAISDDGFVILCNYVFSPAVYYVLIEKSKYNTDVRPNMHLSWTNLQDRYFRHNRVLISGYMNNALTTFWTALKVKTQDCTAIVCTDYDPEDLITTELGETYFGGAKATVKRSEIHPTGRIDFNLIYGPADNAPTEIEDDRYIIVYEAVCGEFTAILSEPADANIDVLIKYVIYNDYTTLDVLCSDAVGETWTIPLGATTDTYSMTLCDTIPVGGCIYYYITVVGDPTWTVSFIYGTDCECIY